MVLHMRPLPAAWLAKLGGLDAAWWVIHGDYTLMLGVSLSLSFSSQSLSSLTLYFTPPTRMRARAQVVFVVRERESHHNSKHQQLVSGVSIPAYW